MNVKIIIGYSKTTKLIKKILEGVEIGVLSRKNTSLKPSICKTGHY